ncbi:holo-ACP synthase [Streptomyces marianii]|uniref:holo-ACP synthase n=1 Tax=Streptomyces marianii TaxID=1817406 RepID=UPI001486F656|nr:holo-ACP synthase [Streptomyces marianii]
MDILEKARFERIAAKDRWIRALFTERELEPISAYSPGRTSEYLAGRFSAKEAIAKVLGVGFLGRMKWRDIEVLRLSPSGKPYVLLHRFARTRANELKVGTVEVSISHQPTVVVAFAVGQRACACGQHGESRHGLAGWSRTGPSDARPAPDTSSGVPGGEPRSARSSISEVFSAT